MATPNKPGKTMSSRLLAMKFMRSAVSSDSSTSTPSERPSKKQRLSDGSFASTPSSTPRTDAQVVEEALAAEEQRRTEALEREAADRGETKWYLSFNEPRVSAQESPLRIVSAGYSALDAAPQSKERSSDDDGDVDSQPQARGRRSFGKFNRSLEKPDNGPSDSHSSSSSSGDENEDDESDDPTGAKALIAQNRREAADKARAERKAKKKAERAEVDRLADERRRKHVKA